MLPSQYHFYTYFDQNYLTRGMALYRSLREHCPEFKLWVLCMDEATHEALTQLDLPEVEPIALQDFEKDDEPLLRAKQNRSRVEYYFTCTPSLSLYILNNWPEVDLITYLDADLFFFSNPTPLFEELGEGSVAIIGHRFPSHLRHLENAGIYNVGWLTFRRDDNALSCLHWWRERCLEWCYDRVEDGRYADQKYLDHFPDLFQGVVVLRHKGANVAPWNVNNHTLKMAANRVYVDEDPLVFFHFQDLKQIVGWVHDLGFGSYKTRSSRILIEYIYTPYIRSLWKAAPRQPALRSLRGEEQRTNLIQHIKTLIGQAGRIYNGLLMQSYCLIVRGRVILL